MLGRLLGGVATSLLFSVFEAWLIRAHADNGIKSYLNKLFSWAAHGNSVVAILAGLVANKAASSVEMFPIVPEAVYAGGYLNPFDIDLVALSPVAFSPSLCGKRTMVKATAPTSTKTKPSGTAV
jgi:hypothetical protein